METIEEREIQFDMVEELKTKTRRIAETIMEMIDDDYDMEDVKSYIRQHLIIANK